MWRRLWSFGFGRTEVSQDQHLSDMLSQHHNLLTKWQTEQLELAQKHEEDTLRLAEEARDSQLRLARDQKFEMQKQQQSKWMQAESLFHKLAKEKEEACTVIDDDLENSQDTINTLTVMAKKSNDELSEARKIAAEMVQTVDTVEARRLIGEARKRKGLGKLKSPVIRFRLLGSIDQAPWAAESKRRLRSSSTSEFETELELSKWEGIIQNPTFRPFKNVETADGTWKQEIDHQNVKLLSLKKNHGIRVYNTVTTALMEMEEYNASGRYPVASAWNFGESRIATMKEVFSHLAPAIETFVGATSAHDISHAKATSFNVAPGRQRRAGQQDKRVVNSWDKSDSDSEPDSE